MAFLREHIQNSPKTEETQHKNNSDGDGDRQANDHEESYSETVDDTSNTVVSDENNTLSTDSIVNDVMISSASLDLQVRETIRIFDGSIRCFWLSQNDNTGSDELDAISALYSLDDDQHYTTEPSGNRALAGALLAPLFLTTERSDDQQLELTETTGQQLPAEPQQTPPLTSTVASPLLPVELQVSIGQREQQPEETTDPPISDAELFQETLQQQPQLAETADPQLTAEQKRATERLQWQQAASSLDVGGDEPMI